MSAKPLLYPFQLPAVLRKRILVNARSLNLSPSDLMRQAMELGMPLVLKRSRKSGVRVTNVAPLPKGALTRAYRQEEADWRRVEAAASPKTTSTSGISHRAT